MPVPGSLVPEKVHLLKVYKQTGRLPEKLANQPELPPELAYLWEWFKEIQNADGPFSYSEIRAWAELTDTRPKAWEVNLLVKLRSLLQEMIDARGRNKASS